MTTPQTEFTRESAMQLAAELRALGIADAGAKTHDYVTPENTVGQRYSVEAVIRDAKHGNTIVRTLRAPAVAAVVVKEMQAEVKARAKGTRSRVRVERELDKS